MSIDIRKLDLNWLQAGSPLSEFPDPRFNDFLASMAAELGGTVDIAEVCVGASEDDMAARFKMGAALAFLALMYGFTWDKTADGSDFWDDVAVKLERIAREGR